MATATVNRSGSCRLPGPTGQLGLNGTKWDQIVVKKKKFFLIKYFVGDLFN